VPGFDRRPQGLTLRQAAIAKQRSERREIFPAFVTLAA
jgi:hypothetical protein